MGGSIALYPFLSNTAELAEVPRTEVLPVFPYASIGHGPDIVRQRQCHIHQILEDKRGLLYALDLGSDRVWIFRREGTKLEQSGWFQCPAGSGPRHAVITPDGKKLLAACKRKIGPLIGTRDDTLCHWGAFPYCGSF